MCIVRVVDPSTHAYRDAAGQAQLIQGIQVLCFATEDVNNLPKPEIGDIIRFNRVKVQEYNNRPQFVVRLGYSFGNASFCLFRGQGEDIVPYQRSSENYTWNDRDAGLLRFLRQQRIWLIADVQQDGTSPNQVMRTMDKIQRLEFFDIICKVVGKGHLPDTVPVLYVWDSRDAQPFPGDYTTPLQDIRTPEQPPSVVLKPLAVPMASLEKEELDKLPPIGTFLPVNMFQTPVTLPEVGDWIKLRNIHSVVVQGQLQATFFAHSKIATWSAQPQQENDLKLRLAANDVAKFCPSRREALLSYTEHTDQPFTTLRQVLMDTPLGQPLCYRCKVRVYDYSPRDPQKMTHKVADSEISTSPMHIGDGGAQNTETNTAGRTNNGKEEDWTYTVRLHVEDATGRIDINLCGPSATAFFHGLPPQSLVGDEEGCQQMRALLDSLLGTSEQIAAGGLWLDMCIMSYYVEEGEVRRPWESRRFMMMDTQLRAPTTRQLM